ncbi:MAG: Septum-associated rare lipoprotein A, partial [uncultured Craurococcus sp.]
GPGCRHPGSCPLRSGRRAGASPATQCLDEAPAATWDGELLRPALQRAAHGEWPALRRAIEQRGAPDAAAWHHGAGDQPGERPDGRGEGRGSWSLFQEPGDRPEPEDRAGPRHARAGHGTGRGDAGAGAGPRPAGGAAL